LAVGSLLVFSVVIFPSGPAETRERDRTLKLYFGHTGERGEFTFKRNGRYDRGELRRINRFLRDWRKQEDADMDPQLLDLVWEIYREAGARDYITVISAYRSPKTNAMLRSRSSGVAKNSQHTRGKAMDFFIPGVPLDKLRAIAMKAQGGGVGYYPRSGSPFVHVDTGSVRAWPRMSRQQLIALFPNGETLHLPPDGKPLPGYERAVARRQGGGTTTLAYLEEDAGGTDRTGTGERGGVGRWLKRVFTGDGEGEAEGDEAETQEAAPAPEEQLVATTDADLEPRLPRPRPGAEIAVAASTDLPIPADATPADSEVIAALAYTPLPRVRPAPALLAASLESDPPALPEPAPRQEEALARLAMTEADVIEPAPARTATGDPIALAFAAVEDESAPPSAEDSAAIAAFAALRTQPGTPTETIPLREDIARADAATEQPRAVLASAQAQPPAEPVAETGAGGPATAGVVLAPDGFPSYAADQDAIRRLTATETATPASHDPQFTRLAMPVPADGSAIYRVPDAASTASDLGEQPLPASGFTAPKEGASEREQGFFMRLFASLIE
jgi:uncharacterized protein YcbK (DUF882 family)